jgi:hypothetical protein
MKVHYTYNLPGWGEAFKEMEMDEKELFDFRCQTHENIIKWFKWEDYYPINTHLVIYAELDGEAYVYQNGWIMSDKEFDEMIANREGIGYVLAIHRR